MCTASMWLSAWTASPAPQVLSAPEFPERVSPSFEDETLVQYVRLASGGQRLRIRLSNLYGERDQVLHYVFVQRLEADGHYSKGVAVSFSGQPEARLNARSSLLSDPVDLATAPLSELRIAFYLAGPTGPCTCHSRAEQPTDVFRSRASTFDGEPDRRVQQRVFLAGVEVEGSRNRRLVVAFGDSITDGVGSTIGANRRWPDIFADRVVAAQIPIGIVNAGIAGNYLTRAGEYGSFGEAGLARFDRDVLEVPGVTDAVILEGINDIGATPSVGADALIEAYRQMISRAHARGVRITFGTISPFRGATYFSEEGEAVRQRVNAWIRTSGEPDGIVDFDAALRDPGAPDRLRSEFHGGDWLHPNDAGYRAMAAAVDPDSFFNLPPFGSEPDNKDKQ